MPNTDQLKEVTVPTMEENKELKIFHVKGTSLYKVAFKGGGVVPEVLSGKYTTAKYAADAIETYTDKKTKDEAKKAAAKAKKEAEEKERQERIAANKANPKKDPKIKDA